MLDAEIPKFTFGIPSLGGPMRPRRLATGALATRWLRRRSRAALTRTDANLVE